MALLNDAINSNSTYVLLTQAKEKEGYTDAVHREIYEKTSIHCPTKEITVQVSLKKDPDETTDEDWHDVTPTGKFVWIDFPVRWLRVKGVGEEDVVYLLSVTFGME